MSIDDVLINNVVQGERIAQLVGTFIKMNEIAVAHGCGWYNNNDFVDNWNKLADACGVYETPYRSWGER